MARDEDFESYVHSDEMLLRRLERDRERQKAKVEAANEAMTRTIAAGLKDAKTKQALARELLTDFRDEFGEKSKQIQKFLGGIRAGRGVSQHEVESGRYWEQDGDDMNDDYEA